MSVLDGCIIRTQFVLTHTRDAASMSSVRTGAAYLKRRVLWLRDVLPTSGICCHMSGCRKGPGGGGGGRINGYHAGMNTTTKLMKATTKMWSSMRSVSHLKTMRPSASPMAGCCGEASHFLVICAAGPGTGCFLDRKTVLADVTQQSIVSHNRWFRLVVKLDCQSLCAQARSVGNATLAR